MLTSPDSQHINNATLRLAAKTRSAWPVTMITACVYPMALALGRVGAFERCTPKFAKKYADWNAVMEQAFAAYPEGVAARRFPTPEHSCHISHAAFEDLVRDLRDKPRSWGLEI